MFKVVVKSFAERIGFMRILRRVRLLLSVWKVKRNYAHVIKRIKRYPDFRKIRVLFIVSEAAKWKCQRVYEELESSGKFEPIVGIAGWNRLSEWMCPDLDVLESEIRRMESFFDKLGDRHVRTTVIRDGKRLDLDFQEFLPDIVYINEPWGPESGIQFTQNIAKFALTIYTPYFVANYGEVNIEAHRPFHRYLHTYACMSTYWAELYRNSYPWATCTTRFVPLGHPALDYFSGMNKTGNKIIYAPHFSFVHPKQEFLHQAYSTIGWNGLEILEYAQAHREYDWVFKPHPILKYALKKTGLLDADWYYSEWAKIGTVCEDGDYQELFNSSFAMITDCGSFLSEYGATGKPLIHLICKDNRLTPLPPSKMVYDTYYKVHDLEEMYATFRIVLENRLDPKREARLSAARKAGLMDSHAALNIVNYLTELCGR